MQLARSVLAFTGLVVVEALALPGCPSEPAPEPAACTLAFLGDANKPVELEIVARDASNRSAPVSEGGDVAIIFPPQGGRVIFVAARVTNIDPCSMKLTGALRDPTSGQVRVDVRNVNLVPDGKGFGAPLDSDISTFSNVPVCPNQWATDDVNDKPYQLEITVTDKAGRTATKKTNVVPRCSELDRAVECRCICKKGYILGQACTPETDAGVDAASDAATDGSTDAPTDALDDAAEGGG